MSWSTVYIGGKRGYKKALLSKLDETWLYGNSGTDHKLMMFWLKGDITLRDFKLAIGSKLVFKYRLQFYTSLEQFQETEGAKPKIEFSADEQDMVLKMVNWEMEHHANP